MLSDGIVVGVEKSAEGGKCSFESSGSFSRYRSPVTLTCGRHSPATHEEEVVFDVLVRRKEASMAPTED